MSAGIIGELFCIRMIDIWIYGYTDLNHVSKTSKQKTGAWGEDLAVSFLVNKGYKIFARNYEVILNGKKAGELDIIAWHQKPHFGNTLCFIEVKTRKRDDGSAERATGKEKLKNLLTAAHAYCQVEALDIERTPIQFEQVSVFGNESSTNHSLKHFVIPVD
jgi:putative endonuclease